MSDFSPQTRILGVTVWRYRPIRPAPRFEAEVWPWREAADSRLVYLNKVFFRLFGWIYAAAWKSKRPMSRALKNVPDGR